MPFICSLCQQSIETDDGWAVWQHLADSPPTTGVKIIHNYCYDNFVQTVPVNASRRWSLVPLDKLPQGLQRIHLFEPYLVGYSETQVMCLRDDGRPLSPKFVYTDCIHPVWLVTLHGYDLQDIHIFDSRSSKLNDNVVSIHVPEFMEASWVKVKIETGEILDYGSDLYDVSVRYYKHNGPGRYIGAKTFIKATHDKK